MKLIKIPSGDGTSLAPDKIIEQISKSNLSEEGILPLFDVEETDIANIYQKSKQTLQNNTKPLFLGGDHSITLPIVKAFKEIYPENPGIIIFDAHPDAENSFMPQGQEDLLCALINQNIIKKANILLVGTRKFSKNELEFIQKNKIRYFSMKEIAAEGIQELSESLMSVAKNFKDLYISIDIDVLDPTFAPGTTYQEPGGLTTRELLFFLHRLKKMHNLSAFDLTEINPTKDINNITSKIGAKILVELC